ncbi:uncharacterized protein LOC121654612 [Melanotaenia boesemani]|uniref:uncharacterized protein LOC121654612 n=1 Tax=Melanotaenia boesemani TaxID=1250792 RepID=UPI001C03DAD9|nr:uncharacterized protein LOC121654612 [Melanotaenia boesemani]
MCGLAALCLLLLQTGAVGFSILAGESFNHQQITERAILNVTVQTCHALALAEGKTFIFPPQPFTADSVAAACEASQSSKSFHRSIFLIKTMNWKTDIQNILDPSYHFDGETFTDGRKLITEGLSVVKAAIKKHSFVSAKSNLGVILHPLQDFYSHSNWVEIGNNLPNSNLIRADTSIGNIAAKSRPTCRNCDGNDCRDNILEDILQEKILTSGYFGFFFYKPTGKCSHGGIPDSTSLIEPKGGINKDTFTSSHGHLHRQAANLAIAATTELLQDVREAAGDKLFLQMLGINKGSSKPICFVLDTTESMRDDIVTVKAITSSIINTKVGTNDEPSSYIIVPFGDPDFGPLMRTTDPEFFENYINLLSADGGGDFPEMSLSGLQLALTGSPSDSEIFVFTDASAKDPHLKDTVMALIEQTNTVVNFLITNPERLNHRAKNDNLQLGGSQLAKADIQLYEDLAQASGGQVIEITKVQLLEATSIISKSSSSSLVSLLQVSRNLGTAENFTFIVDESVSNLTIYITGSSVNFTLISPSGVQHSTDTNDSSIVTSQTMGNFQALHLKTQVGMWKINMASADYYTLRVVGESPVDFLFDFLKESHGQLGGFDLVDNRPIAGGNGSLMVTLTGSDTATVTEVTLVQSSGQYYWITLPSINECRQASTSMKMSTGLFVLCLLILQTGVHGFGILPVLLNDNTLNHPEITKQAILNATVQTCWTLAQAEGTNFNFPPFTVDAVAAACSAPQSSKTFLQAIRSIQWKNIQVDIRYALNASFHFDEEMFVQGKRIITEGIIAVKASNGQENYETARQKLGEILHPLQDFYSHSNWVELGNTLPNSNLIRADTSIGNIADKSRATCRSCDGNDCKNNILEDIISEKILTSGYFGIFPFISTKPKGKCSHGGIFDRTSTIEPKGGINKDSSDSSHGHLHTQAANLAIAATSQLLEDIRRAAGDRQFLQMVGISKGSGRALCFVIDTTKSMSDDIEVVKTITSTIINSNKGREPSVYILVPFSDPGFGPMTRTTDSTVFMNMIDSLTASGGDDEAELSLSGLQLALTSAPFTSEIFLITDAPAKDKHLKSTVIALIERTQTVVNFIITDSIVTNRRRRSNNLKRFRRISPLDAQLYRDLAQVSGGQAIEVTKAELPAATRIITQSATSSLVTLLQAARSPGQVDKFTFIVDETMTNITVYITGQSVTFTLVSPAGVSQESTDSAGTLITASESVGNFKALQLQKQVGQWEIRVVSTTAYTLRVIGQSSIDFLFDFVESSQGPFAGFDALDTRPRAGVNGSLLVSLTGSNSSTVTEAALIELSGSNEIQGVVVPQGSRNFLVQVNMIPSVEFVVQVKGRLSSSSNILQRQSPTSFRGSNLTITADSNSILVPGTPFLVPFSVMTGGTGGNLTIRATNNRGFDSVYPASLFLESGNSTNGTVTLSAPLNTPSGTDIILTIEAEAPGGADTNYIVLRFSVVNPVNDFTPPDCQLLSLKSSCTENCTLLMWELSVRVTDGDKGTGVNNVSLKEGNGTLITSPAPDNENITVVSYTASCCAPDVELLVVDRVGNMGSCLYSAWEGSSAALSVSTRLTLSPFLYLSIVALGLLKLTALQDSM